MFFMEDHSPSYQKLTDWSTLKKMITITILVIPFLYSLSFPLLFPSSTEQRKFRKSFREATQYQIAFRPDKVNCNVHEILTLTMDQEDGDIL